MKRTIIAALLALLLYSCGTYQPTSTTTLPNSNSSGAITLLVAETEVVRKTVEFVSTPGIPVTTLVVKFDDPPIGNCIGTAEPYRFVAIESDPNHPIPPGCIITMWVDDLDYMSSVVCEYECSTPRFIWKELPSGFQSHMEIEFRIENVNLQNADVRSGGLLVIGNADIINPPTISTGYQLHE